jgi:glutathione S-transferase
LPTISVAARCLTAQSTTDLAASCWAWQAYKVAQAWYARLASRRAAQQRTDQT